VALPGTTAPLWIRSAPFLRLDNAAAYARMMAEGVKPLHERAAERAAFNVGEVAELIEHLTPDARATLLDGAVHIPVDELAIAQVAMMRIRAQCDRYVRTHVEHAENSVARRAKSPAWGAAHVAKAKADAADSIRRVAKLAADRLADVLRLAREPEAMIQFLSKHSIHEVLDLRIAQFLTADNKRLISVATVLDLLEWSARDQRRDAMHAVKTATRTLDAADVVEPQPLTIERMRELGEANIARDRAAAEAAHLPTKPFQNDGIPLVHFLSEGRPVCRFSPAPASDWPAAHKWISIAEVGGRRYVTCPECLRDVSTDEPARVLRADASPPMRLVVRAPVSLPSDRDVATSINVTDGADVDTTARGTGEFAFAAWLLSGRLPNDIRITVEPGGMWELITSAGATGVFALDLNGHSITFTDGARSVVLDASNLTMRMALVCEPATLFTGTLSGAVHIDLPSGPPQKWTIRTEGPGQLTITVPPADLINPSGDSEVLELLEQLKQSLSLQNMRFIGFSLLREIVARGDLLDEIDRTAGEPA
jgi:hypothetical protein